MKLKIIRNYNFDTIHNVCKDAQEGCKMLAIIGYTGAGKTTALKAYANVNNEAFYTVCKKHMSPKHFFQSVLETMGIDYVGNLYELIKRIAQHLNDNPQSLLIIDEAGKMSQRMLEYLHDIRDSTDENSGIVLAGVDYFKKNLDKWVMRDREGMPEILGRIYHWTILERPTKEEKQAICKANNIIDEDFLKSVTRCHDFRALRNEIENYQVSKSRNRA